MWQHVYAYDEHDAIHHSAMLQGSASGQELSALLVALAQLMLDTSLSHLQSELQVGHLFACAKSRPLISDVQLPLHNDHLLCSQYMCSAPH